MLSASLKNTILMMGLLLPMLACTAGTGPGPLRPVAVVTEPPGCQSPFPHGTWQFIHAIDATIQGRMKTSVIGITEISSHHDTAHCVLMTVEGFVLFDGVLDQGITVNKAVGPFDSLTFAAGVMKDIRAMFFPPEGRLDQTGTLKTGAYVCRYRQGTDQVVDVIMPQEGEWRIHQYEKSRLIRSVHAYGGKSWPGDTNGTMPQKMTLCTKRPIPYRLNFTLIRAEPTGPRP